MQQIFSPPLVQLAQLSKAAIESKQRLEEHESIREHEMRGPLQVISASAEFVKKHLNDPSATSKERRLEYILANTALCDALLTSIVLPNKQEFYATVERVNLRALLLIIVNVLQHQIEARSPHQPYFDQSIGQFVTDDFRFMSVELRGSPSPIVGNKHLLQRAFYNLGANAVKYADRRQPGKLVISLKELPSDYVSIMFEDTGIGIPEGERNQIFLRHFRGQRALNRPGKGLGLAITKDIVELHGGTIALLSWEKPTTFEVVLPTKLPS